MPEHVITALREREALHEVDGDIGRIAAWVEQFQREECQGLDLPGRGPHLHPGACVDGRAGRYSGVWIDSPDEETLVQVVGTCAHIRFEADGRWRGLLLLQNTVLPHVVRRLTLRLQAVYEAVTFTTDAAPLPAGQQEKGWLRCALYDAPFDAEAWLTQNSVAGSEATWKLAETAPSSPHPLADAVRMVRDEVSGGPPQSSKSHVGSGALVHRALGGDKLVTDPSGFARALGEDAAWHHVPDAILANAVAALDPSRGQVGRPLKGIPLKQIDVVGIKKQVLDQAYRHGFFGDEAHGFAFKNRLFGVTPHGRVEDRPLTREDRVFAECVAPFPFVENAWEIAGSGESEFVNLATQGFDHTAEAPAVFRTLMELVGVGLLGRAADYGYYPLLIGPALSARPLLMHALASCVPRSGLCAVTPTDMSKPFVRVALYGAALNVVAEVSDEALRRPDVVKTVLSAMPVNAQHKHKDAFTFAPRCAHVFGGGLLPDFGDDDLRRKFLVFGTPRVLIEDPGLRHRLAAEAPLIASLAVSAGRDLVERGGLEIPDSISSESVEWMSERDPVSNWLLANLTKGRPGEDFVASAEIRRRLASADVRGDGTVATGKGIANKLGALGFCRPEPTGKAAIEVDGKQKHVRGWWATWKT